MWWCFKEGIKIAGYFKKSEEWFADSRSLLQFLFDMKTNLFFFLKICSWFSYQFIQFYEFFPQKYLQWTYLYMKFNWLVEKSLIFYFWKSFYILHVQHRWVVLDFVDFFIRHDWKLKIPTVGVKIFSSILAEYSALTQVSNALYRLVSDSRAVKMEGNAGDEEGMFSDIRKDYSCF